MFKKNLLAGISLCAAIPANAYAAAASPATEAEAGDQMEEIVVTAQKRTERLVDAPQTVNVVTGDQIDKYGITRFDDVAKLVPGLQISRGDGRQQAVSMRGVTYDSDTQTTPTVDVYLDEVPLDATQALNVQFDIGDTQVLRGPQGTLRGGTGPSGAILIGTRRPDLEKLEINVNASRTNLYSSNISGGVGIPLVNDVLAIRVAGVDDRSDGNGVNDARNGMRDYAKTSAGRISLLFRPAEGLEFSLMHQQLNARIRALRAVVSDPTAAPGAYGTIGFDDRKAVTLGGNDFHTQGDLTILNGSWDVAGHRFSYVGSYQDNSFDSARDLNIGGAVGPGFFAFVGLPFLAGTPYQEYQDVLTHNRQRTHELRFERTGDHFWIYRAGAYISDTTAPYSVLVDYTGTGGTCTQPGGGGPFALIGLPCLTLGGGTPPRGHTRGYFTTQTFSFTDADTFDIGARYSKSTTISPPNNSEYDAWTGSASYKHRFSKALLAYVNAGTSYRPGGFDSTGASTASIPVSYYNWLPEKSKSFEAGIKGTVLSDRLYYSLSAFYQTFDNYIARVNSIACTGNPTGSGPTANTVWATSDGLPPSGTNSCGSGGSTNLTYNAKASARGIEFELRGEIMRDWSGGLTATYADAHFDNALIPCNDYNGDGAPDQASAPAVQRGRYYSLCRSSGNLSTAPKLQLSLNSEKLFALGASGTSAFLRGIARYAGSATNANTGVETPSSVLLDGFVGVRMPLKVEVAVFGRNLTDHVTKIRNAPAFGLFGDATGYSEATLSTGREVGVQLRYDY